MFSKVDSRHFWAVVDSRGWACLLLCVCVDFSLTALDSRIVELESGLCVKVDSGAELLAVGSICFLISIWDSKIVDEKAGLRRLLRGDKT